MASNVHYWLLGKTLCRVINRRARLHCRINKISRVNQLDTPFPVEFIPVIRNILM